MLAKDHENTDFSPKIWTETIKNRSLTSKTEPKLSMYFDTKILRLNLNLFLFSKSYNSTMKQPSTGNRAHSLAAQELLKLSLLLIIHVHVIRVRYARMTPQAPTVVA